MSADQKVTLTCVVSMCVILFCLLFFWGCCQHPYYCKTFTARAVVVPAPCGKDDCRKKPYVDATGYHDLALPTLFFEEDPEVKDLKSIIDIIRTAHPDKKIDISKEDEDKPGYHRLPIKVRGWSIYVEELRA